MLMEKNELLSKLDKGTFFKNFIPSLRVKSEKAEATGLCPFHDDHNPSLSVNIEKGIYKCFACEASGDIFTFYQKLKKVDFPTALKEIAEMQNIADANVKPKVVATFEYKNTEGKTLYTKERVEPGRNGKKKEFFFKHKNGDKWVIGRGCDAIPYNLPQLATAKYAFIVEGEAKADLLTGWGFVATCLDSGANSLWKDSYLQFFRGKDKIVILPDNDKPGKAYALKIANALYSHLGEIKVVNLTELPEKGDIVDWAKTEGNDKDKLAGLIKAASTWEPNKNIAGVTPPILWPEPEPLPEALLSVPALNPTMIPEAFRDWIVDIGERMQCPLDYPAAASIVMIATVVGKRIGVFPKTHDSWLVTPNLWGCIIGSPGQLKTHSANTAFEPLRQLASKEREGYKAVLREYGATQEVMKAQEDAIRAGLKKAAKGNDEAKMDELKQKFIDSNTKQEEEKPSEKRHIVNDTTVEKLGEILEANSQGVLVYRDELTGWLYTLDKAGHESDRAFYLEAWDGNGSFTYDRIGRGTLHISSACISLFGTIQPSKLLPYIHGTVTGKNDDGLFQRLQIMVYPDEPKNWKNIDRKPNENAIEQVYRIVEKLSCGNPEEFGAVSVEGTDSYAMKFTPEAQNLFNEWRSGLEIQIRQDDEHSALCSHLAKYRSLMPSLALLFHLIGVADGQVSPGNISLEATQMAAAWTGYLQEHARRIYGLGIDAKVNAAKNLLRKIELGRLGDEFKVRDIYLKGWAQLNTSQDAQSACVLLVDYGWIMAVPQESTTSGGRPTVLYRVNPRICKQDASG